MCVSWGHVKITERGPCWKKPSAVLTSREGGGPPEGRSKFLGTDLSQASNAPSTQLNTEKTQVFIGCVIKCNFSSDVSSSVVWCDIKSTLLFGGWAWQLWLWLGRSWENRAVLSHGSKVEEVDNTRNATKQRVSERFRVILLLRLFLTSWKGSLLQTFFENNFLACYYL